MEAVRQGSNIVSLPRQVSEEQWQEYQNFLKKKEEDIVRWNRYRNMEPDNAARRWASDVGLVAGRTKYEGFTITAVLGIKLTAEQVIDYCQSLTKDEVSNALKPLQDKLPK